MKLSRFLLLASAALAVLVVVAVVLAFNSGFQTWVIRRVLAAHPELHTTVGSVAAGLGRVELRNVHVEAQGAVLTLPALRADLPMFSAGARRQVHISALVAKGWTLDLSKAHAVAAAPVAVGTGLAAHEFSLLSSARAAEPAAAAAAQVFRGVFAELKLPVDLTVDGLDLAGDVVLPVLPDKPSGRMRVTIAGGGLAAGSEGKFAVAVDAESAATAGPVTALSVRATLAATMDTPRTFTRLGAKADASATGPKFPRGVKLAADLAAVRADAGENYALTLAAENKQLFAAQAAFAPGDGKLTGTWKVDVRDTDLSPFTLGRPLPTFEANGEGAFDTDAGLAEIHGIGKINAAADNLVAVNPALAAMGAIRVVAEFDMAKRGDTTRVERLNVAIMGAQPVATVQSLQTFAVTVKDGRMTELKVADPARDLLGVVLQGVPLAWAQPFLKDVVMTGGDLQGALSASAQAGGFALRANAPVTVAGLSVRQASKPLVRAVDLALSGSAEYTPQGWQAEISSLTAKSGGATLLVVEAKAGRLAGGDEPLKVVGKFSAGLAALLAQPLANGALALTSGDAAGSFVATLDATQQIQAKFTLTNLAADPKLATDKLPDISADLRADIAANGQITLDVPVVIERSGRKSDIAFAGTLIPGKGALAVDARLTSGLLVLDDAKVLAAPFASVAGTPATATATGSAPAKAGPPWAGVSGQVTLALKKVVYSDSFQATNVAGTLRLDAGAAKLEKLTAGLGDGSDAQVSGGVTFDAKARNPYALAADLAVKDFDPAPLFRALNSGQPATVEGKFVVTSKLAGEALSIGDLVANTHGDFQLTSKGGVFRGLPVSVATKNDSVGKLAAGVAFVGSALDVFKGRKDDSEITSTAKAVTEVSKLLTAISYDQLSLVVTRDVSLNAALKDFTLISPEMRITGRGQTTHRAGRPLLEDAVAMEFKLRARGHTADLLKFLGKLETQPDELGYSGCTLPLKVGGTLGKPDTSELNNALAILAIEKSGVLDKAGDLLNRLIPGGK